MEDAKFDSWFKVINEMIERARGEAKAGNGEEGLRMLVEVVHELAEQIREIHRKI
jgi:hypothetical protein